MWYLIKKKKDERWVAYELEKLPPLKRGYEAKGPYRSFVHCIIGVNDDENLIKDYKSEEL